MAEDEPSLPPRNAAVLESVAASSSSPTSSFRLTVIPDPSSHDVIESTVVTSSDPPATHNRTTTNNARRNEDEAGPRQCWICLGMEEEEEDGVEWLHPCLCRGSAKWVHQTCLYTYIDSRQMNDPSSPVVCPQCKTAYLIVFPDTGPIIACLTRLDFFVTRACPFLAAGIVVGSVYWTAVTYGAVTVMQVVGQDEALRMMDAVDPLFLLVALPAIPIGLVLGRLITWEDWVLHFLRSSTHRVPFLKYVLPGFSPDPHPRLGATVSESSGPNANGQPSSASFYMDGGNQAPPNETAPPQDSTGNQPPQPAQATFSDAYAATRVFCGALIFPTIATFMGKMFFDQMDSGLKKTVYGGVTFLAVKGALKIYYKQKLYVRRLQRRVTNYSPPTSTAAAAPRQPQEA
ncbi:unnamed protein product [Cyprideis torosa]|uniref:E3 ubiquitin-protein ligase MARCHF5 n=1 Tax=Cyprideis torosa TaxID=163714 RepID=A0A7R8W2S1_9CRUS|nr:unnamed protein product [Cyprideis torosa]CAG0882152.1 unnamed protein product [Cyprideis torosa]